MAEEYRATCKDCNQEFGYSEASLSAGSARGLSRPERCPKCRRTHSRESRTIGIPQIKVKPTGPRRPDKELSPGRLGKISHPERPHKKVTVESKFSRPDSNIEFGITEDDIKRLIETMRTHQVTVVVGPTGSGKSTFVPYRLMVPPEGIEPDIFTRYGQIVVTQPRIQATRNIARFVARDLHGSSCGAGFDVGFRHKGAEKSDWRNKLVYVTDGTLINWIVSGQISNLSVIMIDEAHERSLNIDLILGLLKRQLPRYPHLKLIIASATINAELFQRHFGGPDKAAILRFRGLKQHRVDAFFPVHGDILRNDRKVPYTLANKIYDILKCIAEGLKYEGDVLGFLSGEGPIETCCRRVRELILTDSKLRTRHIDVYPLYAQLPQDRLDLALKRKTEVIRDKVLALMNGTSPPDKIMALLLDQRSAAEAVEFVKNGVEDKGLEDWEVTLLEPGQEGFERFQKQVCFTTHENFRYLKDIEDFHEVTDRRVIVSTNVAETSLTVDGVVYVVDSGLIKQSRWDSKSSAGDLPTDFHSRAGCRQRWGRAGRVRDGEAHMVYTDPQFEEEFLPYSEPEIKRSSLEDVILKAKAAGIEKLDRFEWIEPPQAEELKRAPEALKKIGALDEEGDLTHYGAELESISTDVPVANLLVAADQFACGVEMGTLAALFHLRIKGGLFSWDNGWDFATKHAVQNIIEGLSATCQDDLEFYLKIYSVWAEAESESRREYLCRLFFINKDNLLNKVIPERVKFLEMLSIGKRSEEDRTINFGLLDRLRMVLASYLPEECFYKVLSQKIAPVFRKLNGDDLPVEVDENSVLLSRLPDHFMALKRRIARRKGDRYLSLSSIVPIEEKWLDFRKLPIVQLAKEISADLRQRVAEKRPGIDRHRLFLDVLFPVGTCYVKERKDNGFSCPGEKISDPKPVSPVFAEGMAPMPEESSDRSLQDLSPFAGWDDREDSKIPSDPYEEEPFVQQIEQEDWTEEEAEIDDGVKMLQEQNTVPQPEERTGELSGLILSEETVEAGKIRPVFLWRGGDGLAGKCEVVGHDFEDPLNPAVILEDRTDSDIISDTSESFSPGEIVSVTITDVVQHPDGAKALRAREKKTGTEFIVDPSRLTFSRRWCFADEFVIEGEYHMAVESQPNRVVTISCLPVAERKMREFLQANSDLTLLGGKACPVSCRLVEIGFDKLYFVLDGFHSTPNPVQSAVMRVDFDSKKGFEEGKTYQLYLHPQNGEGYAVIHSPPDGLLEFVENEKFSRMIFWNPEKFYLHTKTPMTTETRNKLLKFSDSDEYRSSIQELFRHSNLVWVQEAAPKSKGHLVTGKSKEALFFQEEVPEYRPGEKVLGTVSRIYDKSLLVVLKRGGSGSIFIDNLGSEKILDPREVVYVDQEIEAEVICQTDRGVDLTMKRAFYQDLQIPKHKIGRLVGSKSVTIRQLQEKTGCAIQWHDDGMVYIKGTRKENVEHAVELIQELIPEIVGLEPK